MTERLREAREEEEINRYLRWPPAIFELDRTVVVQVGGVRLSVLTRSRSRYVTLILDSYTTLTARSIYLQIEAVPRGGGGGGKRGLVEAAVADGDDGWWWWSTAVVVASSGRCQLVEMTSDGGGRWPALGGNGRRWSW
ncbi:hypothetical protein MA16_Dca021676 [Dendrobium catenatum]|uniref:Uncharacterized protein n=1 Tax=Dendrobium catenatum TaxID=906689 RepID=A0A2I0V774_9ASPA|nr:hypothetical protein MA16_Dca021676 [Dendrobium catenatum]